MKLKKLLPISLAFGVQALFGQMAFSQSRSQQNFAFKRDSVDKAIRHKVQSYLARNALISPLVQYTDKKTAEDSTHYRLLKSDPDHTMHEDYYNLRKEVAANKNMKQGFSYQRGDYYFLLDMKDAEELVRKTDQSAKDHGIDSLNLYLFNTNAPQAMITGPRRLNRDVEKDFPTKQYGIIYTMRWLESVDQDGVNFSFYHEGSHRWQMKHLPDKYIDTAGLSPIQKTFLSRVIETEADMMAANVMGVDAALNGIAQIPNAVTFKPQDNAKLLPIFKSEYEKETSFSQTGEDHASTPQRLYAVILLDEFSKNGELACIYASLMSEEVKAVLTRREDLNKLSLK